MKRIIDRWFSDLVEIRYIQDAPLMWLKSDQQTWNIILHEWVSSHREKYHKYLSGHKHVVQAGGCLGLYPRLFSETFEHVTTFEPDPLNFHCLVNNCQLDRIAKFQAALSDKQGTIYIERLHEYNPGMNRVVEHPNQQCVAVPSLMLDYFDFEYLDLIQLDMENHEKYALYGAIFTINKHKPVIIVENDNEDILNFMTNVIGGYEVVDQSFADTIYKYVK